MTIGERIYQTRKAKGMTQEDLAQKVGCTRKSISLYQRDKQFGNGVYMVARLCKALEVSADWLLGLDEVER